MKKQEFKQGEWVVRRWAKDNGGETDFVRFDHEFSQTEFTWSEFYRIRKNKLEVLTRENDRNIDYYDSRMSLQFRKATKSEIQKFSEMIVNH